MPIQRLHSVLIRQRTDQGNEKALMGAYSGNFGFSAQRGLDLGLRICLKVYRDNQNIGNGVI